MSLFEFLMILLSIIVGLGLAEILTGVARIFRERRQREFSWIHSVLVAAVFFGLLQTFWESWSLRFIEEWTFPAMLLMLSSPILLMTIAHILFPTHAEYENLGGVLLHESRFTLAPGRSDRRAGDIISADRFRHAAFRLGQRNGNSNDHDLCVAGILAKSHSA